jgi:hypothetical protein
VTLAWLGAVAGSPADEIRDRVLDEWRGLLHLDNDSGKETWRLVHASFRDFVGAKVDLRPFHAKIANRYLSAWGGLEHGLPLLLSSAGRGLDGGYGIRHITVHLECAGQADRLRELLRLEPQEPSGVGDGDTDEDSELTRSRRPVWFSACDDAADLAQFVADVKRAWRLVDLDRQTRDAAAPSEGPGETDTPSRPSETADRSLSEESRYALILASMNSLAQNIAPELLRVLLARGVWDDSLALAYVRQMPNSHQQSEALRLIAPYLAEEALPEALQVAGEITDTDRRVDASAAVSTRMKPAARRQIARELIDGLRLLGEWHRADALSVVAPVLPSDMGSELLPVALSISDVQDRLKALCAAAPCLPEEDWLPHAAEALSRVVAELPSWSVGHALERLAPTMPSALIPAALAAAGTTEDERGREAAMAALAERLVDLGRAGEALDIAVGITDTRRRCSVLARAAPMLPLPDVERAIAATPAPTRCGACGGGGASMMGYDCGARVLLASRLPNSVGMPIIDEALEAARATNSPEGRVQSLVRLIPYLPEDGKRAAVAEVLGYAIANVGNSWGLSALLDIACHIPSEVGEILAQQALASLTAQDGESAPPETLARLAVYVPDALLSEIVRMARRVGDGESRRRAMLALAVYLPEPERFHALRSILDGIPDAGSERQRADEIADAAPHLPEELRAKAADKLRTLTDHRIRSRALRAVALPSQEPLRCTLLREALAAARLVEPLGQRVTELITLAPDLAPKDREGALREVVAAAEPPQSDEARWDESISKAFDLMSEDLRREMLLKVKAAPTERGRAHALERIAPRLTESQAADALAIALELEDQSARGDALRALAPRVPPAGCMSIVRSVLSMSSNWGERALEAVAPRLSGKSIGTALRLVGELGEERLRTAFLCALAPHVPRALFDDVLSLAAGVQDPARRADVLCACPPRLLDDRREEVLRLARDGNEAIAKARVFVRVIGILPGAPGNELVEEALEAINALDARRGHDEFGEYRWIDVRLAGIAALVPRLEGATLERALSQSLTLAESVDGDAALASWLSEMTPFFSPPLLERALALARSLPTRVTAEPQCPRAKALLAIARHLQEPAKSEILQEAVVALEEIPPGRMRAGTLARLCDEIPEPFRTDALRRLLAEIAPSDVSRTDLTALTAMIPACPAPLQHLALKRRLLAVTSRGPGIYEAPNGLGRAVSGLIPMLEGMPTVELRSAWSEAVRNMAVGTRRGMLAHIAMNAGVIALLGGPAGVRDVYTAIEDVGRWWG